MAADGLFRELTLRNRHGFHLRPASLFVMEANRYRSDVFVAVDGGEEGNGKSILDLSARAAECGARLRIRTAGPDAEEALAALCALVERGFGEESGD
jgi:phosphotransferase system HPr (HPr) family protein